MKVGSMVVFLFRDSEGFGAAIAEALHPNPNHSSSLCSLSSAFKAFNDSEVSVLLMQNYEPPILACAVNEVLAQIHEEKSSSSPTILVPFVVASSKLKGDSKPLMISDSKYSLYNVPIGPDTDITVAMAARTQKTSPSFQIYREPLACMLQLTRVLNLPTLLLIGLRGQHICNKPSKAIEMLYDIGELLSSTLKLSFSRNRISWNPKETSRNNEEPWQELYG